MTISAILRHKPIQHVETAQPDATVREAVSRMSARGIGAIVISPDRRAIAGILSERDVVKSLANEAVITLDEPVSALMTRKVETCFESDALLEVLGRMTEGRFRHMPVVDSSGGMVGLVSIGDVVKARLEQIEAENAAMVDMLSG